MISMKRIMNIAALLATTGLLIVGCDSKRQPGKIYMPDMAYSRAYESYAARDSAVFTTSPAEAGSKIFYNNMPPAGTIKRGEEFPFAVIPAAGSGAVDSNALINLSSQVKSPLAPISANDMAEASRLFNINCAICHGAKAENNGPLSSKVPGVKSIVASSSGYSDGRIFYVMTYGQNNMGSYASQLDRKQRWMIVQYIRTLEPKSAPAAVNVTAAKPDRAATKKTK